MAVVPVFTFCGWLQNPCNPLCRNSSCSFHPATQATKLLEILKSMQTSEHYNFKISRSESIETTCHFGRNIVPALCWSSISGAIVSSKLPGPPFGFAVALLAAFACPAFAWRTSCPVPRCFTAGDLVIKILKEENIPHTFTFHMFQIVPLSNEPLCKITYTCI